MLDLAVKTAPSKVVSPHQDQAVKLPDSFNYIGVFLTFRCPYSCSYCINRFDDRNPRSVELSGREWISFFDRLDTRDIPVTLQGGEPGCHPDFVEIVTETLKNHHVDILTTLAFDLGKFVDHVNPAQMNRVAPYAPIRISYHPEQHDFQEVLEKTIFLQNHGFRVGLYGVLHPDHLTAIEHAVFICADLGVDFRTKQFLGWHHGVLYGEYAYPGVSAEGNKTSWCECAPTELLVAPDGAIHRCHSYLYAGLPPLGHVRDSRLMLANDYLACNRFGACNPCDLKVKNNRFQQFGHVSARIRNIR